MNRYVRKGPASAGLKPLTLFFAHAIGFMKEVGPTRRMISSSLLMLEQIWEPTIEHLVTYPQTGYYIAEIWSWDAVQHGDSGRVNSKSLSGMCMSFLVIVDLLHYADLDA